MAENSLKDQAQEIMSAVNKELQVAQGNKQGTPAQVEDKANALVDTLFGMVSNVDLQAAEARVAALRAEQPEISTEALVQKLIRDKCQRTAAVGAVTSGAALIPGLGTAAALTVGVAADIGATFKLQAELVLEIAAAHNHPLTEEEKQRVVMLVTGLSAGTVTLARRMGETAALKIGEKYTEKAIMKALPVIGVIGSAGTNVLSTYIIGQRADAYFRLGPEGVGTWSDSVRAVTGLDERRIGRWLAESGRTTGAALATGAGKVADSVGSGAKVAGQTAQKGISAYFSWVIFFWSTVFRWIGKFFALLWSVITFLPRKLMGSSQKPDEQ